MRRNTKIRLLLNILSISHLLLGGLFFVPHVSAEGTRNIGETCNSQIQCKTGLACDDGFCTCNDIGSTPSNHCAAAYPTADAWRCINEAEDPDKSREEWNFCKKADYISSLPKNSTEDVKYPVETKALLGYPCGNDDDVCWDLGGSAGACKKTINASVQSPTTDKFYDPWYTPNSSLYVCALSTGAQGSAVASLVQKWCEHQYGPGTWQAVDGVGELTGLNVCNKVGTPVMSTLHEMRKIVVTESNLVQTTFLGFDISMEAPELVTPTTKIGIPGVFFTNITKETHITTDESGASWLNIPFLGEFISAIYKYSVGLISLIAVMVLIISGVQIITSAGNSEAISSAKHRIVSSVIAIVITAGSYTILYTVNPDLVNLKNLKILVIPTKQLELKVEHDAITESPDAPGPKNVQVFEQSNKLIPSDLSKKTNPIPYLIGELPPMKLCSQESFKYTADALTKQNICVGSCHCAYTSSHFLNYAGCPIDYDGNVTGLVDKALSKGWTEVIITKENAKNLPIGLTWQDGHVGVSIGNGKVFDSSSVLFNKVNEATGNTCPPPNPLNPTKYSKDGLPTIFDIIPTDMSKNCSGCSKIPSEAPATGRFASASGAAAKKYPNSAMLSIVSGGHGECETIQVWGTRSAPGGFTKLYVPPNVQ